MGLEKLEETGCAVIDSSELSAAEFDLLNLKRGVMEIAFNGSCNANWEGDYKKMIELIFSKQKATK